MGFPPQFPPSLTNRGEGKLEGKHSYKKARDVGAGRVMDYCLGKLIVVMDTIIVSIPSSLSLQSFVCLYRHCHPAAGQSHSMFTEKARRRRDIKAY